MMKKAFAAMLICALLLTSAALAAPAAYTGHDGELAFAYDTDLFEIGFEDETDDELTVVLDNTDESWGEVNIAFYLYDVDDDKPFTTFEELADLEQILGVQPTQGEWNGFKNVFSYAYEEDGVTEQTFIIPVYDDDNEDEIEASLTVTVTVDDLEDEDLAQLRDDAISAVLDSLQATED